MPEIFRYRRDEDVRIYDLRLVAASAFRQQMVDPPRVGVRRVRREPEVVPQGCLNL